MSGVRDTIVFRWSYTHTHTQYACIRACIVVQILEIYVVIRYRKYFPELFSAPDTSKNPFGIYINEINGPASLEE